MGLAFNTISSTDSTPFWEALAKNGDLEAQEMGFYLTRFRGDPSAQQTEYGGVFTLGGTNSSLYTGDIEYLDVPNGQNPTYWLLPLTGLTAQGKAVNVATGTNALCAIDTGTTLIGGPSKDVATFWNAIPGARAIQDQAGFYSFRKSLLILLEEATESKLFT